MRAIDCSPFQKTFWSDLAAGIKDPGAAPMLQWVPIAQLRVDPTYQRDITAEGRRSVLAIAKAFDWCKFAPLIVAPIEGGHYAVIDGQHRATAAALRKIESVPCEVVIADRAKQASAFAAINGQVTKLSSMAIYHARVSSGAVSYEAWGEPEDSPFDAAIEAGWLDPTDLSKALVDVMNERDRQVNEEVATDAGDDAYTSFELGKAAAAYLGIAIVKDATRKAKLAAGFPPGVWPWPPSWWRPKDRRRDLVRAGALNLAEIERLDRAEAKAKVEGGS